MQEQKYFAAKDPKDTASVLLGRANMWFTNLQINGYMEKMRQMWAAYHGAYYDAFNNSHAVIFGGEQGELSQFAVNHLRNIATNILVMITATRPSLEARATNNDYRSLVQTKLANGLLDYYMRQKRLEVYLKDAVEYAIVLGSGYIKMEWNATAGQIYDYIEEKKDPVTGEVIEPGFPVHEGDVEFYNLTPFDVMFDDNIESPMDKEWVLCRTFKNKWDIIAKYPDFADKIRNLPTRDQLQQINISGYALVETELIPVYEFYHKKSEAMPQGRYMLFLSENVVLLDSPIPYRDLPVYRIAPANVLGTGYGYTPMFDLLPLQDSINSLYSTILTNQSTFGVQNLWVPRGADLSVQEIVGGLNIVEGNQQFKPEPLNLTQTPPEIFNFLDILKRDMETISGVNSVARGNPESSLKSGTALALVQSQALQFMSGLQQSYVQMIENVGTGLVNMLRDFAEVPRITSIVGRDNKTYMKEFSGSDLSTINRVIVDMGNPLATSTAGKVQMAEQLLQMGIIKNAQDYLMVMETGRLDVMTDDSINQQLLVRGENEKLIDRNPVIAVLTDDHLLHIQEHSSVLNDPELRFDNDLVSRTTAHIQEHINLLRTTDPALLSLLGQQPLGPAPGSPPAPQQPGQDVNSSQVGNAVSQSMQQPNAQTQNAQQLSGAGMPQMPQVPASVLPNPGMQQGAMGNVNFKK